MWGRSRPSVVGEVRLVPGDVELTPTTSALEAARTAVQRRALPTARAHAVLRTPFGRQLAGPGGARHDGPPRGWPRDDLNEVVGDLEGPVVNVEDGFERGEPRYAVPSPAPQRAVDVDLETTPLHSGHGPKIRRVASRRA